MFSCVWKRDRWSIVLFLMDSLQLLSTRAMPLWLYCTVHIYGCKMEHLGALSTLSPVHLVKKIDKLVSWTQSMASPFYVGVHDSGLQSGIVNWPVCPSVLILITFQCTGGHFSTRTGDTSPSLNGPLFACCGRVRLWPLHYSCGTNHDSPPIMHSPQ